MKLIERIHHRHIASRRARVLADHLASVMPRSASVLDVGCGDGEIAYLLGERRPDLQVFGVDVLVRPESRVPVAWFDGGTLPCGDASYDVVSFVDVLHHCDRPMELLAEARRVARRAIVIKDHSLRGFAAGRTLRFMDGVGNRRYGVALPFNYWRNDEWARAFAKLGLTVEKCIDRLGLYPWPLSLAFDRGLHFVAALTPTRVTGTANCHQLVAVANA
jgi:SAM-dependent methyltransferase